jgi:diketogulonate reductase-like aldo/keto reductase
MTIPTVTMNDSLTIPQIALGLWKVKDEAEFNTMFDAVVKAGYRHFDSAQAYDNEQFLGASLKRNKLKREDVFVTTKIAVEHFGYNKAKSAFAESLEKLQMDYVDLLLLHFPVPVLRKKSWQALEELQAEGKAKSIGVSNYTIKHLESMKDYAKITPAVNQVELHVFLQQPELIEYFQANNIVVEAYSPLAHAKANDNEVIKKIAEKHSKSYAQIMLRWLLQQNLVILPKSKTPSRLEENIKVFDFELDAEDLAQLKAQDQDLRTCWSPVHIP